MRERIFAVLFLILTLVSSIAANGRCKMLPNHNERSIIYSCVQATLDDIVDLYKEAEWIEFSVSKLPYIPGKAFASFSLRKLFFFNCDIRYIDPDAFQGLGQLEWLIFHGSNINLIRSSWFKDMRSLTHLSLKKNNIVYIEPELFLHIPHLEVLNIEDNDLDCLPEHALAPLRKLKSFRIGKNPWLCSCYADLLRWIKNRNINLEDEKYSKYECMVDYTAEPDQFGLKTYKREWKMSNNKGLIKMYRNFSTSSSDSSATCTSILSNIPNDVESIELSEITIPKIPNFAFFQFGNNLRSLNITGCHITDIEPDAFAGLSKLERLILHDNIIKTVKYQWFRSLHVLKHLELDSNEIEHIKLNGFVVLDKLETISLNDNKIKCLSADSFSLLTNLRRVNIKGNPWIEECLENFKTWLNSQQIGYTIQVQQYSEGQAEASEHENRFESGKHSTGQIIGSKSTEINRQNSEVGNDRIESGQRHEMKSGFDHYVNSTHRLHYSQNFTQKETITQYEERMAQQQQQLIQQQQQQLIQQQQQQLIQQQQQQQQQLIQQQPQQQPREPQSLIHDERMTQHEQSTTQQQLNHGAHENNQYNTPQLQQNQLLKVSPGDCTFNRSIDDNITYTCIGGDLLVLKKIPNTVHRIEIFNSTIPELPASVFARFINLKRLLFYNCSIRKIHPLAFNGSQKLESLTLTGNNIPIIESAWFDQLNTLTELSLANNSIKEIEIGVFEKLPNLKVLSVENNLIPCIFTNSINLLNKLEEVSIGNNPWKWRCDCALSQFFEESNIRHTKSETCKLLQPIIVNDNSTSNNNTVGKGTTNTSISTVNVICISIAMLIFTKI